MADFASDATITLELEPTEDLAQLFEAFEPEAGDSEAGDLLDWLCWMWAQEGERFYPPDETAQEMAIGRGDVTDEFDCGMLYGTHTRAYTTAVERFMDLENRGFDPRERAEHHIEDSDLDLPPTDWSWWEAAQGWR